MESSEKKLGIVELFAGIGGVARGFEEQGAYEIIALTDIDADARDTYKENFPETNYILKDISDLTAQELLDEADGRKIHGLLGCPPCQGFSSAGKRDKKDPRNKLIQNYFDFVAKLTPTFVVMENVPSVLLDKRFNKLKEELSKNYQVWAGVINAAFYGLPQSRQRAILIAIHRELEVEPQPPAPTHCGSQKVFDYASGEFLNPSSDDGLRALGFYPEVERMRKSKKSAPILSPEKRKELLPLVTVEDAIGDLPSIVAGENENSRSYEDDGSRLTPYQRMMRKKSDVLHNHLGWKHTEKLLNRLKDIRPGKNLFGGRPKRYFSQAYGRLHPRGLARTITANFHNPGGGRFLHYRDLRAISVREAARLQGFDDEFLFIKSPKIQERLVGNAFPKIWARRIAEHLYVIISNKL